MDRNNLAPVLMLLMLIAGVITGCMDSREVHIFIAVHHEPGNRPDTTDDPARLWPALTELVKSADTHGQNLTLLFNPQ
jgi:hypothetical protein